MFIIDFDDETYNNDKINTICDRLTDMNNKYKDCFSDDIYGIAVRLLYKDANGYTINRPFTPRSSTCLDNMYKFAPKRLIQMMVDMHYDNKIHINYMLETDKKFDYITKYTNLNFVNFEEKFYRFSAVCIKSDNIYTVWFPSFGNVCIVITVCRYPAARYPLDPQPAAGIYGRYSSSGPLPRTRGR